MIGAAIPMRHPGEDETLAARRQRIARAYREACELELIALKPGNVHAGSHGHGMRVADFRRSAEVSTAPLTEPDWGLGERVHRAVAATREAVGCNTNLGILLLCAPLAQAALEPDPNEPLRARLVRVLGAADQGDTQWLFRAIRLAAPGGLGESAEHDVRSRATAAPLEVMSSAAARDRIALQYVTGFDDLFERAVPLLADYERRWGASPWSVAALYLDFLARYPDSHVARKQGMAAAQALCQRVAPLAAALAGAERPAECAADLARLDTELKREGINPGTSADLTVASLMIRALLRPRTLPRTTADARRLPTTLASAHTPGGLL